MDVKQELLDNNLYSVVATTLHERQVQKYQVVGNLHLQQNIIEGTIDNTAYHGLNIKQEEINIKNEPLATCAANPSISEEQFICKVCENKAEGKSLCSICRNKAVAKDELINHTRTLTQKKLDLYSIYTGKKPYSCSICGYKTAHEGALVAHMKLHTEEKPYSCSICEYKVVRNSDLVRHVKIHAGVKPHTYSISTYEAAQKRSLVQHMVIHTGDKPYSCSICEYKTAYNSNLLKHLKIHTGEKPYSCSICEYKAVIKRVLGRYTGVKPHTCSQCAHIKQLTKGV